MRYPNLLWASCASACFLQKKGFIEAEGGGGYLVWAPGSWSWDDMPAAWVMLPEDVEMVPDCLNTDLEILVARLLLPRTQGKLISSATPESLKQILHTKSSLLWKMNFINWPYVKMDRSVFLIFFWQGKSSKGKSGNNERMCSFKTQWHLFC